ncbi:MazG family protein [uncultured Amnibacterium sp.]|uniref:MazG family protein n=1 Tax=uncultured Amnibacterium sp. TaxID=1631851 RepID=UPI0035CA750B
MTERPELEHLVAVMARLRRQGGCPWDAEQTHASLVRYLLEETAELVEAIETRDVAAMREELGDVLYQVLFHADLAAATPGEGFDIEDVARDTAAKMIGRHPHVFGDAEAATADAVVEVWEAQKRREKADRTSVLDGVPMAMPSLLLAEKLVGRAERAGLEVRAGREVPDDEDALGDALLDTVIAASAKGLDAERALRSALRRFTAAIREVEAS